MKTNLITAICLLSMAAGLHAYKFLGPKWPGLVPEVTYAINEEGTPDVADEFDIIQDAFEAWTETEGTSITHRYLGTVASKAIAPNHQNLLLWEEGNNFHYDGNVIAVCSYWFNTTAAGQTLTDFDISFNGRDFEWSSSGEEGKMDVKSIANHEIGHALGLGHSDVDGSVMAPYCVRADTAKRILTSDDSLGIVRLYPRTLSNNHAPLITSTPVTEAIAGMRYAYAVTATDADDDTLKYRLTVFPLNMRIDSLTGRITWYPKFLDIGSHTVTIEVKDKFNAVARQTYTLKVGDLVVSTPDTSIKFDDTLWLPVYITAMDGYGILSGNVELDFDIQKLTVLDIDTMGSIIAGTPFARNITDTQIRFAFAAATPYSGAGVLFRIKLSVNKEHCGVPISLPITKVLLNDGDPVATIKSGKVFMNCCACGGYGYNIDGKVLYESNRTGVSDVQLSLREISKVALSDTDGFFEFTGVPRSSKPYTVLAAKDSGDIRNAVSAYDASLVLRHVVGIEDLVTYTQQLLCADVNRNNLITAYDAALILRFVVKINDKTAIGRWVVSPDSIELPNLLEPYHGMEFLASMIGDVSGNWNDFNTEMPRSNQDAAALLTLATVIDTQRIGKDTAYSPVCVSAVSYGGFSGLYSGEFEVALDTLKYRFAGIRTSTLLNGFTCASNVVSGHVLVAFAGTTPVSAEGGLFELILQPINNVVPSVDPATPRVIAARFNEMPFGSIKIEHRAARSGITSGVNTVNVHPNPFNPNVQITYAVSNAKSRVKLVILDASGREVIRLFEGAQNSGQYRLSWNGVDANGKAVASGVYFLRSLSGRDVSTHKLFLMR